MPFLTCSLHSLQSLDNPYQKPTLCAKGFLLHALCTLCRPMMAHIKGLQYMQRAILYLLSTFISGLWWPISEACIMCKRSSLMYSLYSLQAYDDCYKGFATHVKGYFLLGLCTHCRPMMIYIKSPCYVQRVISCVLSILIAGL